MVLAARASRSIAASAREELARRRGHVCQEPFNPFAQLDHLLAVRFDVELGASERVGVRAEQLLQRRHEPSAQRVGALAHHRR